MTRFQTILTMRTPIAGISVCVTLLVSASLAAGPVRLTSDGLLKQRPVWFPDNRRLVFARHDGSTIFLFVLDTRTGEERRLTDRDVPEYDAVPTPDGQSLLLAFDIIEEEGPAGE